jgi:hypothetical protein
MAEKLIYEAVYMTCAAAMVVSVGIETIFFLLYVCDNLIPRRSRGRISDKKYAMSTIALIPSKVTTAPPTRTTTTIKRKPCNYCKNKTQENTDNKYKDKEC